MRKTEKVRIRQSYEEDIYQVLNYNDAQSVVDFLQEKIDTTKALDPKAELWVNVDVHLFGYDDAKVNARLVIIRLETVEEKDKRVEETLKAEKAERARKKAAKEKKEAEAHKEALSRKESRRKLYDKLKEEFGAE